MSRWCSMSVCLSPVLAVLCAGCTYAPQEGRIDRVLPAEYPQIAVLEGLDDRVFIHEVQQDPGPPMNVTVFIRNNTDKAEQKIQYRYLFFDGDHRQMTKAPDWHFKILPARTKVAISGNAMDRGAVEWNLEIRPAH